MDRKTSLAAPRQIRLDLAARPQRGIAAGQALQPSFEDLGTALCEVTFVVVDLETTGGSPGANAITEVGAVKVCGGEILAEFQTLVNPGAPIPPEITSLTGITSAMVASAPQIGEVLPSFLEWARFGTGPVLVAHNARFDVSFLKAATRALGYAWPAPQVVDTLALARKILTRQEVPNFKLSTLARLFRTGTQPSHRALEDARSTTDLLHGLLERFAPLGVTHLEDLLTAADPVPARRRRKVALAENVPRGPGVYQFLGPGGEVLYVGTATDLRSRVRSYFTAAETRKRIGEMVDLASEIRATACATVLEARVLELRLIDAHQPPYNRHSRNARARPWLVLTTEPHPRTTIVRNLPISALPRAWGPFPSASRAREAATGLARVCRLRTCTSRLPRVPPRAGNACPLHEMGSCLAPCASAAGASAAQLAAGLADTILRGDTRQLTSELSRQISLLAQDLRYEDAAGVRDQLRACLAAGRRAERLRWLLLVPELVAARPDSGGWELILVRWGRLAGCHLLDPGREAGAQVEELRAAGEQVAPPQRVGETATVEESELLADWLDSPGARLVACEETPVPFAFPLAGAHSVPLPPGKHDARARAYDG